MKLYITVNLLLIILSHSLVAVDLSLDQYLENKGFSLCPAHSKKNEGYMTEPQKQQFIQRLASYRTISSILEIGLNAGHSAENFFQHCKAINTFVSFDINIHPYTQHAADYLQEKYGQRFIFITGDSKQKVPEFLNSFPQQKFDLIYIDGDHRYDGCKSDIINCKQLAHKNTILWIDDCNNNDVERVVNNFQKQGFLKVIKIHKSQDPHGNRSWVEACYVFKKLSSKQKRIKNKASVK